VKLDFHFGFIVLQVDFGVSLITDMKLARLFVESEEHHRLTSTDAPVPPKTMKEYYAL